MKKFFQYINKQPKSVRDNYALGIAAAFTSLVMVFWFLARPNGEVIVLGNESESSPFSSLISATKDRFSELTKNNVETQIDNSQVANVINATTTSANEIVLTKEDIEKAKNDQAKQFEVNSASNNQTYTEVLIATTSSSTLSETSSTTAQ